MYYINSFTTDCFSSFFHGNTWTPPVQTYTHTRKHTYTHTHTHTHTGAHTHTHTHTHGVSVYEIAAVIEKHRKFVQFLFWKTRGFLAS